MRLLIREVNSLKKRCSKVLSVHPWSGSPPHFPTLTGQGHGLTPANRMMDRGDLGHF